MSMGNCRECGKETSSEATNCPHCGARKPVKNGISPTTAAGISIVALFIIFNILPTPSGNVQSPTPTFTAAHTTSPQTATAVTDGKTASAPHDAKSPTATPPEPFKRLSQWDYQTYQDEMSGKLAQTAAVTANERLSFRFPYNGGSFATLLLRKHPRTGTDVILMVDKGHFLCNSYDGCSVSIKFDDGKPVRYSANPPADHSRDALFLKPKATLISAIKRAGTVRIEAQFYQDGNRVMTFQTEHLDWPK